MLEDACMVHIAEARACGGVFVVRASAIAMTRS